MLMNRFAGWVRTRTGWRRALVAFGAGAASDLAMAPFHVWPVLIVTLSMLVWLIDGAIAPLARRFYADAVWTWRENASLLSDDPALRSMWIAGALGYAVRPWLHLEGVYNGLRQQIDRPGGRLHRNQLGFQIVTTKSLRIR